MGLVACAQITAGKRTLKQASRVFSDIDNGLKMSYLTRKCGAGCAAIFLAKSFEKDKCEGRTKATSRNDGGEYARPHRGTVPCELVAGTRARVIVRAR